jgi:hypothetical protein
MFFQDVPTALVCLDLDDEWNGPVDLGADEADLDPCDPGELDAYLVELLAPDDEETEDAAEIALLQELGIDHDLVESAWWPRLDGRPMAGVEVFDLDRGFEFDDELAA